MLEDHRRGWTNKEKYLDTLLTGKHEKAVIRTYKNHLASISLKWLELQNHLYECQFAWFEKLCNSRNLNLVTWLQRNLHLTFFQRMFLRSSVTCSRNSTLIFFFFFPFSLPCYGDYSYTIKILLPKTDKIRKHKIEVQTSVDSNCLFCINFISNPVFCIYFPCLFSLKSQVYFWFSSAFT